MLMVTLRKPEFKKIAAVCAGAVLCAAAALAVNAFTGGPAVEADAAPSVQVTDLSSLTAYLTGFGLEIDPNSVSVDNVKIPRKWDDSFTAFNDVIKEAGLDLKSARGKDTEKWMALVPAKSDEDTKLYAVVITYKDTPVGAYFLERPSGEVLPMAKQSDSAASSSAAETAAAPQSTAAETAAAPDSAAAETAAVPDSAAAETAAVPGEGAYPTE